MTNEHTHAASILGSEVHWTKSSLSSAAVNSRIGRGGGGGGGGLKHMLTVHPITFRVYGAIVTKNIDRFVVLARTLKQ